MEYRAQEDQPIRVSKAADLILQFLLRVNSFLQGFLHADHLEVRKVVARLLRSSSGSGSGQAWRSQEGQAQMTAYFDWSQREISSIVVS